MKENYVSNIIIVILTLIYLFIFSSSILAFTNFNPVIFNIISTIIVFFLLKNIYNLYIKKYQLNTIETIIILISYVLIFIFFTFDKHLVRPAIIDLNPIPDYFLQINQSSYLFFIASIVVFIPLGFFYSRFNLKFKVVTFIVFPVLLALINYYLNLNNFSLATIILNIIGLFVGSIYFNIVKDRSYQWNNLSFDIRLNLTLMFIIMAIALIISFFLH